MTENIVYALLLTLFAGLSTGIGSCIAFISKNTDRKFLSFALGLSAGVMIYISFMEIIHQARLDLGALLGSRRGDTIVAAAFFGGMFIAGFIDKMVPAAQNPHELHNMEELADDTLHHHKLQRMGLMTALAIAIHNFPEGIATFISAIDSPRTGIAIAAAIAIHNIPEGIAVSIPIYAATGSRRKAFWYSLLSGLAEPLGALAAFALLLPFMTPVLLDSTFAAVAGIMIYISLDELLPAAREYGLHHISIYGLVTGMLLMAVSLILLM